MKTETGITDGPLETRYQPGASGSMSAMGILQQLRFGRLLKIADDGGKLDEKPKSLALTHFTALNQCL
jgi:hypothetical protein